MFSIIWMESKSWFMEKQNWEYLCNWCTWCWMSTFCYVDWVYRVNSEPVCNVFIESVIYCTLYFFLSCCRLWTFSWSSSFTHFI